MILHTLIGGLPRSRVMSSELGRYLAVSVAMIAFLAAAQSAAGFGWRSAPAMPMSAIR